MKESAEVTVLLDDARAVFVGANDHIDTISQVRALCSWDQQTQMPKAGAAGRGKQLAMLTALAHQAWVDPALSRAVDRLASSDRLVDRRAGVVARRQIDRRVKVSAALVSELASAQVDAFHSWTAAKSAKDMSLFAPQLQRVRDLSLRRLECIDPHTDPYDVALQAYEPGATVAGLRSMFDRLSIGLRQLLDAVEGRPHPAELGVSADVVAQRALHQEVARAMGYDFGAGRLDESAHPFTIGMGVGDVRITTRVDEQRPLAGLGATMHEVGHALYEQGLPERTLGAMGLASAASTGVHESQSRFWERFIGGSRAFCDWLAPVASRHLGCDLDGAAWFQASNRIQPSLIRVYADEVTYNLHVIVRFELELQMLSGTLPIDQLERRWNERYEALLGIVPDHAGVGVLQDVHWSSGYFGYFPTYTLGNLHAASLGRTLLEQQPDLWGYVRQGQLGPVLSWLRACIHRQGSMLDGGPLIEQVCGPRDGVRDLLDHLWGRQGALYGVQRPESPVVP